MQQQQASSTNLGKYRLLAELGSGGMARAHMESFTRVRKIRRLQVYSPTPEHRQRFGDAMAQQYGIEVQVCERPQDVYHGAHIVAGLTDSAVPVLDGRWLEPGAHIVNIGGGGTPDPESLKRVDRYLRFGDAPAPLGRPEFGVSDEFITYAAKRPGAGVSMLKTAMSGAPKVALACSNTRS